MKNIINYVLRMGFAWFIFRIKYYIKLRYGFFERSDDKILQKQIEIKKIDHLLTIYNNEIRLKKSKHIDIADNAISGKIFVFSNMYLNYLNPKRSHYNPISKYEIDNNIHWSQIPDFGELGDIKIPWEYSRFPHFFSYIKAHKLTNDKKYVEAFKNDINTWINENEYPYGINYKCGQEMTFRLFSIVISINYFYDYMDKAFIDRLYFHLSIYGYRIKLNIDYAVVSVKNDHAISESIGLILCGLLFQKSIKEAKKWFDEGKKILINELDRQVYSDGSYLCHSFNYQREVLDELTLLLLILNLNCSSEVEIIEKIRLKNIQMIKFLHAFVQENGWLPNYGSNDGALLFPVLETDYRDYRDSLNFANVVASGNKLYKTNTDLLDFFSLNTNKLENYEKESFFEDGGYYILKNEKVFSFVRCHSYKDRPSQNDMFHLDVWYKGENIFCDAGTFSYNTNKDFKGNFQGTVGHNTVLINDKNQMEQVLNFGWSNWTKAKCIDFSKNHFVGENYAYQKKFGIIHKRDIKLKDDKIIVIDNIKNIKENTNIKQIWNTKFDVEVLDEYSLKVDDFIVSSNIKHKLEVSYISDYYNSYIEGTRIIFETDITENFEIKTLIEKRN